MLLLVEFDIPSGDVQVKSLGKKSGYVSRRIKSVRLLGSDQKLEWSQGDDSLVLSGVDYSEIVRVPVFKVEFR